MKVLHLLDHALPIQSGYAFRSDAILRALQGRGLELCALTSPKHEGNSESHGPIRYFHASRVSGSGALAQARCVREARLALKRLIATERPDVIHAHSPCLNG